MTDNTGDGIRLRCLFCARNPERYKKCRSCSGAGFPELSQVKDHLKRVHPPKCPMCSYVFQNSTIEEHATQHPNCKFRPKEGVEYMTAKQWHDVSTIPRRGPKTSPGEQWERMFRILFPDSVQIPPPYLPSLDQYRQIARQAPAALLTALETRVLKSGHTMPFFFDKESFEFCLRVVLPELFDLVSERGLLPGGSISMSVPQLLPEHGTDHLNTAEDVPDPADLDNMFSLR